MSSEAAELESWTTAWTSQGQVAAADLRRLRRRTRRHVWSGVGTLVLGVAFLTWFTVWTFERPEPTMLVAAVAVWALVLGATAFELSNRRGTWRPRNDSTRAFLELSELQARRRRRGVRFGWLLLAAETAFFLPWIAWEVGGSAERAAPLGEYVGPYAFLAAMVGGFAITLRWLGRRSERELAEIHTLRADLAARWEGQAGGDPPHP
jgi:hypothetical protein